MVVGLIKGLGCCIFVQCAGIVLVVFVWFAQVPLEKGANKAAAPILADFVISAQ